MKTFRLSVRKVGTITHPYPVRFEGCTKETAKKNAEKKGYEVLAFYGI